MGASEVPGSLASWMQAKLAGTKPTRSSFDGKRVTWCANDDLFPGSCFRGTRQAFQCGNGVGSPRMEWLGGGEAHRFVPLRDVDAFHEEPQAKSQFREEGGQHEPGEEVLPCEGG